MKAEEDGVAEKRKLFGHEAIDLVARQIVKILPYPAPTPTTTKKTQARVLTYVTPSPSAKPIPITAHYQKVTSYVPIITLCKGPPIAHVTGSFRNPGSTFPPFRNYSVIMPTNAPICSTEYRPTITPICYTVLSGLASRETVSDCAQEITFSKATSFELLTPAAEFEKRAVASAAPYIQTINEFWVAPWDELTTPGIPPTEVEHKICRTYLNLTEICVGNLQRWQIRTITEVRAITTTIDLTTTINGPAEIMIETWKATITGTESRISLSTELAVTYGIETETTVRSNMTATKTATSTRTVTRLVGHNSVIRTTSITTLPSELPSALFPVPEVRIER